MIRDLADATRAFLASHGDALARAGGDPARALPVVRALLEGLDDVLLEQLNAADAALGVRAGPPDGVPAERETAAFLAGDAAVRAAWASRAVRAARHAALLALAGLEGTLGRVEAARRKGEPAPVDARRSVGGELRVGHALTQLAAALDAWEAAALAARGEAAPARAVPPGELLLRAREALASGMTERAARLAVAALDARWPAGAPARYAPLREAFARGEPDVVPLALLDGVEAALREP